jgi:hypothetical protein
MKNIFVTLFIVLCSIKPIAAQSNWAAIPCSKMGSVIDVDKMWLDSLHNEIILYSISGHSICNTTYKGLFAYNGSGFHDLDKGVNTHDSSNLGAGGAYVMDCITYGNRTLFGGSFNSVGSNILYAKSLALWNGTVWDTLPTHCFSNGLNGSGGGFLGFLKYQGKLWMYGAFDTIGNTITKNITAYDGNTFTPVPAIPVNNPSPISKMIVYKNKLIAAGGFYDYPSNSISELAQYDGTGWTSVGTGVLGGLSAVNDMIIYKDTLFLGGAFPKSAGNAGNYVMKWDGSQLYDAGFGSQFCDYGAIKKFLVFRNRLYAFGNFDCVAGQKAFGVAYYENGVWTVPQDSIDNTITGAVVYNDAIYIGGAFWSINSDTTIRKFAKLMCPDFDASAGCVSAIKETSKNLDVKLFPNPSKDKIRIQFEQSSAIDRLSISNTLGQEVFKMVKPQPDQEIDVSYLPAGIYFLKAENKQGQGVFKVVKEE